MSGAASMRWQAKNPEARRRIQQRYQAAHPEKVQLWVRRARLKRKYGITLEEYEKMLAAQGGVCALCGRPPRGKTRTEKEPMFCVDHCHKTGRVRGLLCGPCNLALGNFEDDITRLERAIRYLKGALI